MDQINSGLGYIEITNAVDVDVADRVRCMYENADYDLIHQTRKGHFHRMFPGEGFLETGIPDETETYSATFYRSRFLETSELIRKTFNDCILPKAQKFVSKTLTDFDIRAYKLESGGHFRLHLDDYTADVGFIWYLSKNWRWDWGGY